MDDFASQVSDVAKRYSEVLRARLTVSHDADHNDVMRLFCEVDGTPPEGLAQRIADSLREVTKLRGDVDFKPAGSLPNDGKVIEDLRKYD